MAGSPSCVVFVILRNNDHATGEPFQHPQAINSGQLLERVFKFQFFIRIYLPGPAECAEHLNPPPVLALRDGEAACRTSLQVLPSYALVLDAIEIYAYDLRAIILRHEIFSLYPLL